jgi:hypothetical protein
VSLNSKISALLLAALGACAAMLAHAETLPVAKGHAASGNLPQGTNWTSLSGQQRSALAPLERDWNQIDATRKAKWMEIAARFPTMPLPEQKRVQERMAEWARMTPVERGRARLSFQESKQFTPEQKQARWEAYKALPDDERRALASRNRPSEGTARVAAEAASTPLSASQPKSSLSGQRNATSASQVKPVAPTIVQAGPGATTTLMTSPAGPPAHHQPGQPKIAAKPGQVDRSTLLPRSGPQAAASAAKQP